METGRIEQLNFVPDLEDIEQLDFVPKLESPFKRALKWTGQAIAQGMRNLPGGDIAYETGSALKKHFKGYTPEEIRTKPIQKKEPDVIKGQPVEWKTEDFAWYKGENGDILNYRDPKDRKEIDKRLEQGERFNPSVPPEGWKPRRYAVKTGKATGELGRPMFDPVTDFTMGAVMGGKLAYKAGARGGKLLGAVIKKGLSDVTFGGTDVVGSVFKGIRKSKARKFLEVFVKDDIISKEVFETPEIIKSTVLDPHEVRKLFFKRTGNQLGAVEDTIKKLDKDRFKTAKKLKLDPDAFKKDVNDYLVARHAPDYNREWGNGAAKITTEEAGKTLKRIEESPQFEQIKRVADDIKNFHDETLEILYANGQPEGVITKQQYDILKEKYPNHVSLFREIKQDEDIFQSLSGAGMDVKSSGLYKGGGSDLDIKDILENVYAAKLSAIQRVEKNIVDNATHQSVQDFIKSFPEQDLFRITREKAVGTTFEGGVRKSLVDYGVKKTDVRDDVLQFKISGEDNFIKINNPDLAEALKGVNREDLHKLFKTVTSLPYIGKPVKAAAGVPGFTKRMATYHNPAFAPVNKLRDLPEALVYLASRPEATKKMVLKVATTDLASGKHILDYWMGRNTKGAKLYKELLDYGGIGKGHAYGTREQVAKSFEKIYKENRSKPRQLLNGYLRAIDEYNGFFEDTTRLTVYRVLKEGGIEPQKAAVIAKDCTIDFDQRGKIGGVLNSLYYFFNPSIQGTYKSIKALKDNPKLAASVALALGTAAWSVKTWNDRIDPENKAKIPKSDQLRGLNIVIPTDDPNDFRHIHLPVSYGLLPVFTVLNKAYDLSHYDVDVEDTVSDIMSSVMESWSPVSAPSLAQTAIPSIVRPEFDVALNRGWHGHVIAKEDPTHGREHIKYYPSFEDTAEGKLLARGTKKLADITENRIEINPAEFKYVLDQYISGGGRFYKQIASTAYKLAKGKTPEPREIPFASRFYRKTPPEYWKDEGEKKLIRDMMGELKERRFEQDKEFKKLVEDNEMVLYEFLKGKPFQDKERIIRNYTDVLVKDKMQNKLQWQRWFEKLSFLPVEIRKAVFKRRYKKAPENVKRMMDRNKVVYGIFTDSYVTAEIPEKFKEE